MALTRKFLSALGIEDVKIDEIIEVHTSTVNNIKSELESYKEKVKDLEEAEKKIKDFDKIQKELDKAKEDLKNKEEENSELESKYDDLNKEYDKYKNDVEEKEVKDSKIKAFKDLLKESNISEKRFDAIIKLSNDDIDKIELDDDGSVKNKDDIVTSITDNWSEYVQTTEIRGANPANPPANNGGDKNKISRAKQIAQQYHDDLYGKIKED